MSSDSLQDIASGTVKGVLSYSEDKINELVTLFINRREESDFFWNTNNNEGKQ